LWCPIQRKDVLFSFAAVLSVRFILDINHLLGQNVLLNFVTGRYHRPWLEEHIFLFIDIEGSTALAERLGELAFHWLVNRFVVDITDPIVAAYGEIHRYVGDELIATWKLADGIADARCVRACFDALDRPCLRCRPETSPELAVWRGSSNTVSRALQLIEAGGLDNTSVEALAARLGIGERQLRRLFRQHLGAPPTSIAQTRRILPAKQLIHDTRLPMTEVAAAAGFGSIRRFNEIFQQLYGRPPKAIRRTGVAAESAATTGAVSVELGYRSPYDWGAILSFLRARAIPGVEVVSSGRYARTIAVGDQRGILIVEPAGRNCLKATIRFPNLENLPAIIARVRRLFDLAADPLAIDAHLSRDPVLAPLVAARPGLRVPGAWDGFELAVRAILGQQITVPGGEAPRQVGFVVWRANFRSGGSRPRDDACVSHASATGWDRFDRDWHAES
jgi:methylphosphotriester-DNA--protein-cysteine methyltransferase